MKELSVTFDMSNESRQRLDIRIRHGYHVSHTDWSVCYCGMTKSGKTIATILSTAEGFFLAKNYAEVTMDQIAIMRLVRRDVNVFPAPVRGRLVRAYQAALPSLVEAAIRDGIRDGTLAPADPRLLAWHFIATVEVTLGRHADSVLDDSAAKLDYVLDLFFHGAAAPRRTKQGA